MATGAGPMPTADVTRVIERAIASRAFPAAAIEVGRGDGVLWNAAFGRLTYAADAAPASAATLFDLASLTKVLATTPLVRHAVDARRLSLDDRVADHLPAWRGSDRETVTIADLLEHAAGLTAYLPFFRDHHDRADFEQAICTLPLEYAPRTQSIYSDLGFMLLAFILEDVNHATFARQFGELRLQAEARGAATGAVEPVLFNPPRALRERCAPTELDLWRGRLLQGEVHDENAWALGGAAGHAGLFGTAAAVGAFARTVLNGLLPPRTEPAPRDAELGGGSGTQQAGGWQRLMQKSSVPGSSRALGWDTMVPTSSCGTRMSARAIGHTGFTGTSLWIDPAQDLYVVFLTNRVHPARDNNQIQSVRRAVHDAAVFAAAGEVHSSQ